MFRGCCLKIRGFQDYLQRHNVNRVFKISFLEERLSKGFRTSGMDGKNPYIAQSYPELYGA